MFKKLREKITEEVQQTSLRLPASVQQSVQQLTQLSPFSGAAASPGQHKRELAAPAPLQDELLVDISDIRPAGHNKDLFSIDEDSHEGSPSKSGFQLVDLSDAEAVTSSEGDGSGGHGQGVAGVTFDPSTSSPALRSRRDSASSSVSDASGLFPIYEVPGVSFNMPVSDLESSSEWEEGGSVERLSKDTVYQAYLKMRQRYHKYKGRYADLARAYKDKEKESDKLRDVLAKTQDKALRKVSELREQCSLEQQAKAHLEQELRSDLEEKDHKIAALLTKVSGLQEQCLLQKQAKAHLEEELNADLEEKEMKISALKMKVTILQEGVSGDLANPPPTHNNNNNNNNTQQQQQADSGGMALQDEGDNASACDNSSSADNTSTAESVSTTDNISLADNVSVASHGSASTTVTATQEAEELIEKLKACVQRQENGDSPDVSKHKSLLSRCMDNIRTNKERIGVLTQERDVATAQLQEKIKHIDILKEDHLKELDSLRASMESSALSMAETKKQLFEELQNKEAEAERCKKAAATLEAQLEEERSQWQEQLENKQRELEQKEAVIQELGTNSTVQEEVEEDTEASVATMKREVEVKINQLEARTQELKESRTDLETQLLQISDVKAQLEERVLSLTQDKEDRSREIEVMTRETGELEVQLRTAQTVGEELESKLTELETVHASLKEDRSREIEVMTREKGELEVQLSTAQTVGEELESKLTELETVHASLKEEHQKLIKCKLLMEEKIKTNAQSLLEFEKKVAELKDYSINEATVYSGEITALKEVKERLANHLERSHQENTGLKTNLEEMEKEKEMFMKDLVEKDTSLTNLEQKSAELGEKVSHIMRENVSLGEDVARTKGEKELLNRQINESLAEADREKEALSQELQHFKQENERINNEFNQTKLQKETENKRLVTLERENAELKSEKDKLNLELTQSKANISRISEQAFAELTLANEKMEKLQSDWAKQMEEKVATNDDLSKQVSELNEKLVKTSSEYEQKINDFSRKSDAYNEELQLVKSQLQEKNEQLQECLSKLSSLDEVNETLKEQSEKARNDLLTKETEIQSECNRLESSNSQVKEKDEKIQEYLSMLSGLKEENKQLKEENSQLKEENSQVKEENSQVKEENSQVKEENSQVKEVNSQLKEENSQLKEENSQLKEENNQVKEENSQLKEENSQLKEENSQVKEENSQVKEQLEKTRNESQTRAEEMQSACEHLRRENEELNARVVEVEASLDSLEAELTAVGEEKRQCEAQLQTLTAEKTRHQEELQALESHLGQLKKEFDNKEKNIHVLREKSALSQEEYGKVKEEMAKLTETFEAEMRTAKDSYAKLKQNYQDVNKEREEDLAHQNQQNTELKSKLLDTSKQFYDMQTAIKQKNERIENLLHEKKVMLSELEKKVEDLQDELKEKETFLKVKTAEFASKVEELEAQMSGNEEDLRKKVEESFQEKHRLELRLAQLSHHLTEKDELAVRQAEEAERQLTQVQQQFAEEKQQLEAKWEHRLRCELDQLKKHQEEALMSGTQEASRSHQAALAAAQSGHRHSVATRDATIAALKDEGDQQREELQAWQLNYQDLESQLAEAKCQIEKLQDFEACLDEARAQVSEATAKRLRLEESLTENLGAGATLTAQIDQLRRHNQDLQDTVQCHHREKEETDKRLAALELSNERSKNQVVTMEQSQKELQERLNTMSQDKERLLRQFEEGSTEGVIEVLVKEKQELEERLTREKETQLQDYKARNKALQEQLEGLVDVRHGYEKQISQIEASNAELHSQPGSVQQQQQRDAASSETLEILAQKQDVEDRLKENIRIKEALKEEITVHKATLSTMKQQVEAETSTVQTMVDTISTLQNNILNLQKQVEGLHETCGKLARDLEAESKLRVETQMQLTQAQRLNKQLQEHYGVGEVMLCQLKVEQDKLQTSMSALSEANHTSTELQTHAVQTHTKERTPLEDRTDSPRDGNEQLAEKTPTNVEQRIKVDEVMRLKAVLGARDEDLSRTRHTMKELQERLRIAEVVTGEVEEYRSRVRELEAKLSEAEEGWRQQVEAAAQEAARRVAAKEQECLNTISSAYDQQDSETTALVRQHQEALREAQQVVQDKAAKLDTMSQDYVDKLKEKDDELCKFVLQYEEQLARLNGQHEAHIREVEATWKVRAEKMVRQREGTVSQQVDALKQEWTNERRSPEPQPAESPRELERLTQVAAAAFQSGTESVELLKKQVAAQRRELEGVKLNHGKEVGELKALLELKPRSRDGRGGAAVRLGVSLEEAAEFEYLKNVLYQYMLGKETQTLSKVLCAVVKFDGRQQEEILEREEQRQNVLQSWSQGLSLH